MATNAETETKDESDADEEITLDDGEMRRGYNAELYSVAFLGGSNYRVALRDSPVTSTVNLEDGTVEFDGGFDTNPGDTDEYRHQMLLAAMDEHDIDRVIAWADAQAPLRAAEMYQETLEAIGRSMHTSGGSGGTAGTSDGDDADDADDLVTEVDPTDEQAEKIDAFQSWMNEAAGFHGFDASIIELSWAKVDGEAGIVIEANPFQSGYWSDGDWQDKEGFQAEKETLTENILQARDEIQWFGDPDYVNFLPESDIEAFTE